LLFGLGLAMLMALVISGFEETLAQYIIIASFIPVIVYISGALTAQTVVIFVRDLTVISKGYSFKKYFFKQLAITFLISVIISLLLFLFINLFWSDSSMAFVISLATGLSLILTALVSVFLVILIKRFHFDPALGSGPVATVISDILSIVIYFVIVLLLL
jgi:magnesium transporter